MINSWKYFEIGSKDFLRGMSSSNFLEDGGFSNVSGAVNLGYEPGVLHVPAAYTDKSSGLTGSIIASCEDPGSLGFNRLFVAASGTDGKFVTWDNSALNVVATDSTRQYVAGKTDMATFGTLVYGTSHSHVFEWTPSSGSITQDFFSFTSSTAPHPVLNYENNIFFGDGNLLLRKTAPGAGAPTTILTLDTTQTIVALGIDPGSGKMLISTITALNASDTLNPTCKVLYYDGFSNKVLKSVIVDNMITAFFPVGGTVFIGYGQNIGYWTGSGVQFLRKLNVSLSNTELPYKHHFASIDKTLYVIEKNRVLAFGEVIAGRARVFRYVITNPASSNSLSNVANIGSNKLGFSFATSKFYTIDTSAVPAQGANSADPWISNHYDFPRLINLQTIRVEFSTNLPSTAGDIGTLSLIDSENVTTVLAIIGNTVAKGGAIAEVDVPYPTLQTRSIQLKWSVDATRTEVYGIKRFTVFYTELQ